ncbi:MAG: hypothetical protein HYY17_11000 [Planctomycetes bacterium]|nr:hypothetical protein [Planctomycetota bacterium]
MPDPNDFAPRQSGKEKRKGPKAHAFVKPDLEVHIDERQLQRKDDDLVLVCRCDTVCTCNTVVTGRTRCRCDTVSKCTCEAVQTCTCNTVMVCSCDSVKKSSCSCDSHSPGGGGSRVCRCVPVRAH